jgi:hypothetical protein
VGGVAVVVAAVVCPVVALVVSCVVVAVVEDAVVCLVVLRVGMVTDGSVPVSPDELAGRVIS